MCLGYWSSCVYLINLEVNLKKSTFWMKFENALIQQPLDGFWFPTPEMKALDAYVPFLLSKPLNKNEIWELFCDINWKIFNINII